MRLQRVIEGELNKLLIFELEQGLSVEAVHYRGDTLCVSTQVGCAVGCGFCASGSKGLFRNLTAEEIVKQVILSKGLFPVKRVAIAGIGEPLANFENVLKAFWEFKKMSLKVSFYTVGSPIARLSHLLELPHGGVTISIHSMSEEKRKLLMPYAGSLHKLLEFLRVKLREMSTKRRRKISLAYLLLKGFNDSIEELYSLARTAKELNVSLTLLYYNRIGDFLAPSPEEYERAFLFLRSQGVRVTLSTRFRRESLGGCGTLTVGRFTQTREEESLP